MIMRKKASVGAKSMPALKHSQSDPTQYLPILTQQSGQTEPNKTNQELRHYAKNCLAAPAAIGLGSQY